MINKLIKTEEDYGLVLSRIEDLMDAEANTTEAEELELLATLVELYEDEHYAMDTPEPVDAIKFRMEQLGLNQQGLVPFIGSKSKVSDTIRENAISQLKNGEVNFLCVVDLFNEGIDIPQIDINMFLRPTESLTVSGSLNIPCPPDCSDQQ